MCTIIFAYNAHPRYPLILLGNRDEFKSRPSLPAHFHGPNSNILSGVDLKDGGIWTGINKKGKISFLTNYRDFSLIKDSGVKSRGQLGLDYLIGTSSASEYIQMLYVNRNMFNPYNLVIGDIDSLHYYSNISGDHLRLESGIHGLSNAFLNSGWYKTEKAKNRLRELIDMSHDSLSYDDLFEILNDREVPSDELLPMTGLPMDKERLLSSIFVDSEKYGTIFQTVILIDSDFKVNFYEKSLNHEHSWEFRSFEFYIER